MPSPLKGRKAVKYDFAMNALGTVEAEQGVSVSSDEPVFIVRLVVE